MTTAIHDTLEWIKGTSIGRAAAKEHAAAQYEKRSASASALSVAIAAAEQGAETFNAQIRQAETQAHAVHVRHQAALRKLHNLNVAKSAANQLHDRTRDQLERELRDSTPQEILDLYAELSPKSPYQWRDENELASGLAAKRSDAIRSALKRLTRMELQAILPDKLAAELGELRAGVPWAFE